MNKDAAQTYTFLFDLILTAADYIAGKLAKARAEGLISAEDQQSRAARIDGIRAKVGLPAPTVD